MNKFQKGFTLIELLIVIAIIGILASIILVSLQSGREKAKVASFKSLVHTIQTSAISQCDNATVSTSSDLRSAINTANGGSLPSSVLWNTAGESANCGDTGSGQFTLFVDSVNLTTMCTATLQETGVTNFSPC